MYQEQLSIKFLKALEKTRTRWANEKQYAEIIKKMEQDQNLKEKEFATVYFLLRENC